MDVNKIIRVANKPLMLKLKSLIIKDGVVDLFDSEVMDWLREDFGIETNVLDAPDLLRFTYLAGRAFLDWPGWKILSKRLYEYQAITDQAILSTILENYYKCLGEYILYEVEHDGVPQKQKSKDFEKLQLTKLAVPITGAVESPRKEKSKIIGFSLPDGSPYSASIPPSLLALNLNVVSFATIMNWWCFGLHVKLSALMMRRETNHIRTEMSAGSPYIDNDPPNLLTKFTNPTPRTPYLLAETFTKKSLMKLLNNIMRSAQSSRHGNTMKTIIHFIMQDFLEAPPTVDIPGSYIKSMNNHPYNRCMYKGMFADENFDDPYYYRVHSHQTMSPRYTVLIQDAINAPWAIARVNLEFPKCVFIRCNECRVEFAGPNMLRDVKQHFIYCHMNEGSWQCPYCKKWMPMTLLAEDRWCHACRAPPGPYDVPGLYCNLSRS